MSSHTLSAAESVKTIGDGMVELPISGALSFIRKLYPNYHKSY